VQSTDDGVFALFGAPIAHEEHPQRAIHAALRMQAGMHAYAAELRANGRAPIEIRVGINTGEVVVRSIRTNERNVEYTPIGHTTNLASRLQTIALTGAVVISGGTERLVAGYFKLKPMGPVKIRGVSEPVEIYEVTGLGRLRTRLQASTMRGLSRFIGRGAELARIRSALEIAKSGRGQMIAVRGDAGVGKSRLFYEFKETVRASCLVLEAYGVSHGANAAYIPVIELLNDYFGIVAEDEPRRRRERVIGNLLTLERTLEETLPYLFGLLGINEGPDPNVQMDALMKHRRTLEAIARIIEREGRNQPVIFVVEDLHWLDSASIALIDLMADRLCSTADKTGDKTGFTRDKTGFTADKTGDGPILMMVNYRPEYAHRWGGRPYFSELMLEPFGREAAGELLRALLGGAPRADGALGELERLIAELTAGNPLFIEEIVRALFEQGILARDGEAVVIARPLIEAKIPPTIEGIIASRIDRIPAAHKELIQTLAVAGRELHLGLVRMVAGMPEAELTRMLAELERGGFIYEEPAAAGEIGYSFKHALTQEVAYNSILTERRRMTHQRIAAGIEAICGGRVDDYVAELAHHYGRSGNASKAAEYLRRAAAQAAERSAYAEAVEYLRAGLKAIEQLPAGAEREQRELELTAALGQYLIPTAGPGAAEVKEAFERARQLCEKLGDSVQLFWIVYGLQFFYMLRLEIGPARELGERQMAVAERAGDPGMIAAACVALAQTCMLAGEFQATRELCEKGLAIPRVGAGFAFDVGDPWTMMMSLLASALMVLGYPEQAAAWGARALAACRKSGTHAIAIVYNSTTQMRLRGRYSAIALELADAMLALAREQGFSMWAAQALSMRGEALIQLGRVAEGIAALVEGATAYATTGATAGLWRLTLAEGYGMTGRAAEGLEIVGEVSEYTRRGGIGISEAEMNRVTGELHLAIGAPGAEAEAERSFRAAIETARRQSAKLFELRAVLELAPLLERQGREAEARALVEDIVSRFSEGVDLPQLNEARALLAAMNDGRVAIRD
jgi:predicted ATPase